MVWLETSFLNTHHVSETYYSLVTVLHRTLKACDYQVGLGRSRGISFPERLGMATPSKPHQCRHLD